MNAKLRSHETFKPADSRTNVDDSTPSFSREGSQKDTPRPSFSSTGGDTDKSFVEKAESKLMNWISVLKYGKSCDVWTRMFQAIQWNHDCCFGKGDTEIESFPHLVSLLSSSISNLAVKVYYHPLLREVLTLAMSVTGLPSLDEVKPSLTFRSVCTLLSLMHRHIDINESKPVNRFISILRLYDNDNDECLTIYELFAALYTSTSLSVRLSGPSKAALEISRFAKSIAWQATKAVAECVYPNFDESLIVKNDGIKCILTFDEIRDVLSAKIYLLSFLFNPAALDNTTFIPQSYRDSAQTVLSSVLSRIHFRELKYIRNSRYESFSECMRGCRDMPTMMTRYGNIRIGLLRLNIIEEPRGTGEYVEDNSLFDPEWVTFLYFLNCAIPDSTMQKPPVDERNGSHGTYHAATKLKEFLSVAGVFRLQEIGESGSDDADDKAHITVAAGKIVSLFPQLEEPVIPVARPVHPLTFSLIHEPAVHPTRNETASTHSSKRQSTRDTPRLVYASDYCPVCDVCHK